MSIFLCALDGGNRTRLGPGVGENAAAPEVPDRERADTIVSATLLRNSPDLLDRHYGSDLIADRTSVLAGDYPNFPAWADREGV